MVLEENARMIIRVTGTIMMTTIVITIIMMTVVAMGKTLAVTCSNVVVMGDSLPMRVV